MKRDDLNSADGKTAMISRRIPLRMVLGGLLLALPACKNLTSPNFNFGDVDDLAENPSRASTQVTAQGLTIGSRLYYGTGPNDLVSALGMLGRESYNHDALDPRFESEYLRGPLDAGSPAFGGNFWAEPYANIKLGSVALAALDVLPDDPANGFTPQEKEYLRGYVKTLQAYDFLTIVNTRDETCGCAITLPDGASVEPEPEVGKDQVFAHIEQLLDEARGHFAAAGNVSSPIQHPGGYDGIPGSGLGFFTTAPALLQFSRGLRARVAVYVGDFNTALSALAESFLDTGGDLDFGVYHSFSPLSGDKTNGYFEPAASPNLRAHPSIVSDVQLQPDGTPDDRFVRKTRTIDSRSYQGLCTVNALFPTCAIGYTMYLSLTAPIPIIKNEELILLRAEANIGLENLGAALADINFIRTTSGKLAPLASLGTPAEALAELLYNKRYSLLWEGGLRWIDLRRYGLLGTLPLDLPGHSVQTAYPIPIDEVLARG